MPSLYGNHAFTNNVCSARVLLSQPVLQPLPDAASDCFHICQETIAWFIAALTCMLLLTTHSVSSGDEAAGAERCEEEEDEALKAGKGQTACMAEADQTAYMDQEDEPAWLEIPEKDQTGMGERGEGPKTEEEGQSATAEQDQTALVNEDQSHRQDIGKDKGECQEGTLDKEEDGKGSGDKPMEEEDKEVEDEPEELLDGRTPARSASLITQLSTRPNCIEHL